MQPRSRARRRLAFFLPLLLLGTAPGPLLAADAPNTPWLYRGSDVPQDPAWTFGELPNGLRYAVRHNGVPPDQVSIRIRIDAGSLYESEAERGYAHLIEHLTFRESKYLKEGEAIPIWQRLGATFGSDTNAETTPTQTVYKLPTGKEDPLPVDVKTGISDGRVTQIVSGAVTAGEDVVTGTATVKAGSSASAVPLGGARGAGGGGGGRRGF